MNLKRVLSRLGQFVAALCIFTTSHAWGQSVITQTATFSGMGTGSTNYSFNSFDSSLGTLVSVQFELLNVTTTGSATIYNISNVFSPPGYNENMNGGFSNVFNVTATTPSSSGTLTVSIVSSLTATQIVTPGGSFTTGTQTGSQSPNPQTYSSSDLADFITSGSGTVTLNLTAQTSAFATGSAGTNTFYFGGSATALASGTLELIYTYTPVPEPRQTMVLLIGFAMCVYMGRNYFQRRCLPLA